MVRWRTDLRELAWGNVILKPKLGVAAFVLCVIPCVVLQFVNVTPPWPDYMTRFINLMFAFGVGSRRSWL
jgi:hypothetical protein